MIVNFMQKKLKISLLSCLILVFFSQVDLNAEPKILGCFCEGGLIYGEVSEDAIVFIDNQEKMIFNDGFFIHAIGRKSKDKIGIKINGLSEEFVIKKKKYKIERISGLSSNKVQPDKKSLDKIFKDSKELKIAKRLGKKRKLFNSKFLIPVKGRLSGVYGSQRILNGKPRRPHYGIDIAAPKGTKVISPTNGFVKLVSDDMFFTGKTIIIDHGLGLLSIFAHLNKINVSKGQKVQEGQKIGEVGMTGRATGPHLHWGIYLGDVPVDPEIFLK